MQQGFVSLGDNGDAGKVDDTFWPSFTDIMMVVVMIFMIASIVLVVRNWELLTNLRATMEAERQASQTVQVVSQANETLEEQLANTQHQLSLLRMQLMQATESDARNARLRAEAEQRVAALQTETAQLNARAHASERQAQALDDALKQSSAEAAQLRTANVQQQNRIGELLSELTAAEQRGQEQAAELGRLRQAGVQTEQRLTSLEGEYASLKTKYDRLVRPARTAQGKHVVEVRYAKDPQGYRLSLKEPGDGDYRLLSQAELDARLAKLQQRDPRLLYVKVVIPSNSGLSYDEAWRFTSEVLAKYDYYYQD